MNLSATNGDAHRLVWHEDEVVHGFLHAGWPLDARQDWLGSESQARAALDRLIGFGLPFRKEGRDRYFDFYQAINFLKQVGLEGREPTYLAQFVPMRRRLTLESQGGLDAPLNGPNEFKPRRFLVSLRREFNLVENAPGAPLRLRFPVPFEDSTQKDVGIEILEPVSDEVTVARRPGYIEFRALTPEVRSTFPIEVQIAFTAFRQSIPLPAPGSDFAADYDRGPEFELYTRPNEGMIKLSPAIVSLAEVLASGSGGPLGALTSFWKFFFDRMRPGWIHHDQLDRDDPLGDLVRLGWFDCFAGHSLLIALCRSRGIPARLVHGIMLHESAPTFHYWAEVMLPPNVWTPVDLESWDLSGGDPSESPWSTLFLSSLEHRLKLECFPRSVVGPPGIRFPRSWYISTRMTDIGTERAIYATETSQLIHRDVLHLVPLSDGHC